MRDKDIVERKTRSLGLVYQSLYVKMSKLGGMSNKAGQPKHITDGGLGAKPTEAGRFFGKTSYFNVIGSQLARVHSHLKELDL